MDLSESERQRMNADYTLRGRTPRARSAAARALVTIARRRGEEPDQWVLDVAEGRLPA
ncbi:hypothetical protein MYK68_11365 [Gordonia sp. PP30]|uniref:hypothetical protein n=1 Tax=unclassified Gordonia (in: high G+C Gram-positive bacteria) TaxID=2657482 RepID=UPI001FFE3B84|nr:MULTISPECIES: hypothetical protein [unclassified Gordonia (in: high G+C Gram-positive bacteria)]UQE73367.1 hypothetical protein MYK68_11365 [Gordonia sp. PP30]